MSINSNPPLRTYLLIFLYPSLMLAIFVRFPLSLTKKALQSVTLRRGCQAIRVSQLILIKPKNKEF